MNKREQVLEERYKNFCNDIIPAMEDVLKILKTKQVESTELNIIYTYLVIRYVYNCSIHPENSGALPVRFRPIAKSACESLRVNLEDIEEKLSLVNKSNKTKTHYNEVIKEFAKVKYELDKLVNERVTKENKVVQEEPKTNFNCKEVSLNYQENITTYLQKVANKLNSLISPDKDYMDNIINYFNVVPYHGNLVDNVQQAPIDYTEAYIISQYLGQNDINIGAYAGITSSGQYFYVLLGTKCVINYCNNNGIYCQADSHAHYFDSKDVFINNLFRDIYKYLDYTNRLI